MFMCHQIAVWDLVAALGNTMDLVSPSTARHHEQVCHVAFRLGQELGLDDERLRHLTLAAALHDCGALTLRDKLDLMKPAAAGLDTHAYVGAQFLRTFKPFRGAAGIVAFLGIPWRDGEGAEFRGQAVPIEAHILHLADRAVVLAAEGHDPLFERDGIVARLRELSGPLFAPDMVEALERVAMPDAFWLDLSAGDLKASVRDGIDLSTLPLTGSAMLDLARLFARIVDFRSAYWATHTAGVAKVATLLAGMSGMSEEECHLINVAALLHNIGCVAIPPELLEKQGRLEPHEVLRIRTHAYHTYRCLAPMDGMGPVRAWASLHHERLSGTGYPFRLHARSIPLGARILAVADTFAACTADRPYRPGMNKAAALQALNQEVANAALDGDLVSSLSRHYDSLNEERVAAQQDCRQEYDTFFGVHRSGLEEGQRS